MPFNTSRSAAVECAPHEQATVIAPPVADRRKDGRIRTVYRLAPIKSSCGTGLARVRDISDEGMRLQTNMPVMLGDRVGVRLSDTQRLEARVVWTNGEECGLRFDAPIDSANVLRLAVRDARQPGARPARMELNRQAVAMGDDGPRPVRVCDISQRGMKLAHRARFTPGMPVKVILESGFSRRGVVRWNENGFAGVMLSETFEVDQLGRLELL